MEPVPELLVQSTFQPAGDQPTAIAALAEGIKRGDRFQTLLGITGSGKSATIAWTIEQVQKPTLILAPNKSLAAQLAKELREFFPQQPGRVLRQLLRLLPARGVHPVERHLHREGLVDQRRDRPAAPLGHRRPAHPAGHDRGGLGLLHLRHGQPRGVPGPAARAAQSASTTTSARILRRLVDMQYDRNDMTLGRGKFRVRGDTIEVHPAYDETVLRIEMFGDTVERHHRRRPAHRRAAAASCTEVIVFPATHYVAGDERMRRAVDRHRGRAAGAAGLVREGGQAARGAAPAHAHAVRPRDDAGGRLLQRHRELLDAHRRPQPRRAAVHPARLLPRRLPARHRREPPVACPSSTASTRATAAARTCSSSTASACPAPGTTGRCASRRCMERVNQCVFLSATPGRLRAAGLARRSSSRSSGPTGLVDPEVIVKPDQGPDRRPDRADQRAGRQGRPRPGHHAHQEDGRGPHRLPARAGPAGALPALQHRHHPAHRDPAGPAPRRVRRAGRHQPAARGPRPARGVAGRHPRRRQGGLPAQRDVAHPDHRPGRPQRRRPGGHVRRHGHRLDAAGHRRDQPPAGLQVAYNAEHGIDPQTIRKAVDRHPLDAPAGRDGAGARARTGGASGSGTRSAATWPSCPRPSWRGSSRPSRRRCTRPRPSCASSTPPACATRSTSSVASSRRGRG